MAEERSFSKPYASAYDALYSDKDYEAECDLIERLIGEYSQSAVRTILDLGCGTGGHSIPLSRRGYDVTGVDLSEGMLAEARQKSASGNPNFVHGDVRRVDLSSTFDLVLMMFAVLGYQTTDEDLGGALRTVRKHLRSGGLFIGDVWYGPAVIGVQPSERSKAVQLEQGELIRLASPTLDNVHNLVSVHYRLMMVQDGKETLVGEEDHTMRYFFAEELEQRFQQSRLEVVALVPFPESDGELDSSTWNALFVAKAV